MPIRLIPVIPNNINRINVEGRVNRVKEEVKEESDRHLRMFGRFTATWSAPNKPKWDQKVEEDSDGYAVVLSTRDTPFVFVEKGTSIRFRAMTRDFQPKTRPRVIGSRQGAGGVAGKSVRPGITARNIRNEIAERRAGPFTKKLVNIMRISSATLGFTQLAGTPASLTPQGLRELGP